MVTFHNDLKNRGGPIYSGILTGHLNEDSNMEDNERGGGSFRRILRQNILNHIENQCKKTNHRDIILTALVYFFSAEDCDKCPNSRGRCCSGCLHSSLLLSHMM